jgi:deferrochelatase/peroxidase EfeB
MRGVGIGRRGVLAGAAAVVAAGANGCSDAPARSSSGHTPALPHQPGVLTPPPASARLAAFDVAATDRAGLVTLLRRLSDRIGQANGAGSGASVTIAFGASLFDDRFGLAALRPRRLTAMTSFPNDVLDPAQCHGDLLLQVCAEQADRVTAIADDLTATAAGGLKPRWHIDGSRAENQVTPSGKFVDRNPFGFRDGAGNPDVADDELMDRLLWAAAPATEADGEPAWTAGGTYQVVRLIRFATALWNADPVSRQEAVFGRYKSTGAPLGRGGEDDDPGYADDPHGIRIPLDAHMRRANPRTPQTEDSRILRRGYAYQRPDDAAGQPDVGLAFICFQADLERGFVTVQRRLAGEALDRYVLPFGGGYFFVPPGLGAAGDYLGRTLIDAAG